VELLHGGVRGAELEKREQSSPKHPLICFEWINVGAGKESRSGQEIEEHVQEKVMIT
jgi:hypothetical protein